MTLCFGSSEDSSPIRYISLDVLRQQVQVTIVRLRQQQQQSITQSRVGFQLVHTAPTIPAIDRMKSSADGLPWWRRQDEDDTNDNKQSSRPSFFFFVCFENERQSSNKPCPDWSWLVLLFLAVGLSVEQQIRREKDQPLVFRRCSR